MKTFKELVKAIVPFQLEFTTLHDNSSIETFGTIAENYQSSVPASADFHTQERREFVKQSAGESILFPPQAVVLCDLHRQNSIQTVANRPVDSQPIPIGLIYKPNRESIGTYLDPRTPPAIPQKSARVWRRIICSSKSTPYLSPQARCTH